MNLSLIPPKLHAIIPIVEEWGHLKQHEQDAKLMRLARDDPARLTQMAHAVEEKRDAIREWSAAMDFPRKHKSEFTDEDWANPYWQFISTLSVLEGVPGAVDADAPEVRAATERMRAGIRKEQVAAIKTEAAARFRDKDYAKVVELLRRIEPELTSADRMKLQLAEKKLA